LDLPSERTRALVGAMAGRRIMVVGDIMLDHFVWGDVTRISPEAPVPVVRVRRESYHAGAFVEPPFTDGALGSARAARTSEPAAA